MRKRWPAEWEPHDATWLSWPHRRSLSWPDEEIHRIRPTMLGLTEALAATECVYINVTDEEERNYIESHLAAESKENVRLFDIPSNDPWCRDHGPTFILDGKGNKEGVCWRFNGWGDKYQPWDDDAAAGNRMAAAAGIPFTECDLVLEPGGLEGNGAGLALVSRRSVVDERRNPGKTAGDIEGILRRKLDLDDIVWVDLEIEGDDTDGHVDNFARFVSEDTLAVTEEGLGTNPHLEDLGLRILQIPSPHSKVVVDDFVCPASYANFYIANEAVIVPQFDDQGDAEACALLSSAFPDRRCIPLSARELITGQGGFHCITQQVPSAGRS